MGSLHDDACRTGQRRIDEYRRILFLSQQLTQDLQLPFREGPAAPRLRIHGIEIDADIGRIETRDDIPPIRVREREPFGDIARNMPQIEISRPTRRKECIDDGMALDPAHSIPGLRQSIGVASEPGGQVDDLDDLFSEGPLERPPRTIRASSVGGKDGTDS